jgi:protein AIR1/2
MSSTAVLEIIDLTDSPPADNETQKVPKTADYSTNQDPEKSSTRAARKRKNGEAPTCPDGSLEHGHAQSGESTETQHTVDTQESNEEPKGKKKRRSKKNKDKENKYLGPPPRENTQHDALPTLDNDELFFVDTAPRAVPDDLAFDPARDAKLAPSSPQTLGPPDKIPLLLPAHVSVLDPGEDLLVRIIQPAESDSDSDSYIEYLDYDDRLVCSQHFLLLIMNPSLISHRHPTWCATLRLLRKGKNALFANDAARRANTGPENVPC